MSRTPDIYVTLALMAACFVGAAMMWEAYT